MRRVLFIANTYYQLIMAIQMKNTMLRDVENVLLLSDHSMGTDMIAARLREEKVFDEIHYVKTKLEEKKTGFKIRVCDIASFAFFSKNRFSYCLDNVTNKYFDEIICYNFSKTLYGIFSELQKYNPNIVVSGYEEGVLSYNAHFINTWDTKRVNELREMTCKKSVRKSLGNFYCFYPSLYSGKLKAVGVPRIIPGEKTSSELKRVFNLDEKILDYPEKYIFFTSVYDFEGGEPIGEFQVVEQIANFVGKDNLLVKIHPRDTRTIYTDNGFRVDNNSGIPWEAIQLSGDFSDKIFLTATSGSVLAGSFMAENAVTTYYMFRLCNLDQNVLASNSAKSIENLLKNDALREILQRVVIAERIEDILG